MNLYAVIIVGALLFDYVLGLVSDVLNVRAVQETIPDEFAGVYDPDAYRKSQDYLRTSTRFGIVSQTADLLAVLLFWFLGGFRWLERVAQAWTSNVLVEGIVFVGLLMLLRFLFSLPFSCYGTFVIEERFGFNRTTVKTFVADRIKGLLLTVLIGVPVLAGVLGFFQYAGDRAWIYCWIGVSILSVLLQFIAPVWIMPLFNTFTPLEDGELRDAILHYADQVKFSVSQLSAMDGSRRSSHSNAFVAGFGRNKRVALFDTLIAQHEISELVAILAHEVGHWKHRHIIKTTTLSIAHTGVLFFLLSLFLTHEGLFSAFGTAPSVYGALVYFGLLFTPIELMLGILLNALSRRHEFQADAFAVASTGDPGAMISALKKLSMDNLSNLTPHSLTVFLEYSHPPVLQRIRAIRSPG